MARIADIRSLRAAQRPSPPDLVRWSLGLLSYGRVRLSLRVDGGEVVEGVEDYWALLALGCRSAPVSDGEREVVDVPLEALGFYDEVSGEGPRVYADVLALLRGDRPTPLVMVKKVGEARIWAKLEWYNPLSLSIKDRTALNMVDWSSEDVRGRRVYEASSSNTGVALAALSRLYGFTARIYIPETAEPFGPELARLLGAEVVVKGGSTSELRPLVEEEARRDGAIVLNQFQNYLNPLAHIRWTAKEIDYQSRMGGLRLRAVFVTMGTGGHAAGVATYFALRRPEVRVVGVQPAEGSSIPGIKRQVDWPWGQLQRPREVIEVSDEEALRVSIGLAREVGLLFGPSGGAALAAALRSISGEEGDYVIVVPDHGVKYLRLYSEFLGQGSVGLSAKGPR
ncbi:MAG: PLP-dependent cysteine synthase family protein [Acidilobus sp.]